MSAYYNDNDPFVCQWLRNLIAAGHIAPGDVDDRSISDVRADDLKGYTQCHFFAGIGGWSYALRIAGWPDDRPVWTGSCPCQPFSGAGSRRGFDDERHLWPAWRPLVEERRPTTVFGEQVADASDWLRLVRSDLVSMGYAVGCIPIEASSIGASHARDRYWFVADAHFNGEPVLAFNTEMEASPLFAADADGTRLQRRGQAGKNIKDARNLKERDGSCHDSTSGIWRDWTHQPVLGSGVHGLPGRVAAVRAYGNAIVPQVAAEFIGAVMDCIP